MNRSQENLIKKGVIRSTIRMLIPLNKQSESLEILGLVSGQNQFEPGCISSRLYRGADEVREIMFEELWANDEAMLSHLRSEAYQQVLLVVEMADEPPEIRFDKDHALKWG